jgi:hypothetical protein
MNNRAARATYCTCVHRDGVFHVLMHPAGRLIDLWPALLAPEARVELAVASYFEPLVPAAVPMYWSIQGKSHPSCSSAVDWYQLVQAYAQGIKTSLTIRR